MSFLTLAAAAEEHTHELPMSPYAFGAIALALLLGLMTALLVFGKGRPHS